MQKYRVFGWCLLATYRRDWRFQLWGREWLPDVNLEVQCKLCKKHCTAESLEKHMRAWTWEHCAAAFFCGIWFLKHFRQNDFRSSWWEIIQDELLVMNLHDCLNFVGFNVFHPTRHCDTCWSWSLGGGDAKVGWSMMIFTFCKLLEGSDERSFWGIFQSQNPCERGQFYLSRCRYHVFRVRRTGSSQMSIHWRRVIWRSSLRDVCLPYFWGDECDHREVTCEQCDMKMQYKDLNYHKLCRCEARWGLVRFPFFPE